MELFEKIFQIKFVSFVKDDQNANNLEVLELVLEEFCNSHESFPRV